MKIWDWLFKRSNKKVEKQKDTRYILCIDGGGMRGIIPIEVLKSLEAAMKEKGLNEPLVSYFDMVSGTSTGGLIALSLTCMENASLNEVEKIYMESGSVIFPPSRHPLKSLLNLFEDKYSPEGLMKVLNSWFGEKTVSQACKPTLIVSFNLENGKEKLIKSWEDTPLKATEAGRATSAAPTYFPVFVKDGEVLADGGVVANNPSVYAYFEAKKLWPECKKFVVVSLSTAASPLNLSAKEISGLINWADKISPMYTTAQKEHVEYVMSNLNDVEYIRINGKMQKAISMDDASKESMNLMYEFGNELAENSKEMINHIADLLQKESENVAN